MTPQEQQFHRIEQVCKEQGISLRTLAKHLSLPMQDVREQLRPSYDLNISELLAFQAILQVPLADLLIDSNAPLSEVVASRAQLVRIAKTIQALAEICTEESVKLHIDNLMQLFLELFPEAAEISAWHSIGRRRDHKEASIREERIVTLPGLEE